MRTYKEVLIESGFKDAGVYMSNENMNMLERLLTGKDATDKQVGDMFKYTVLRDGLSKISGLPSNHLEVLADGYDSDGFFTNMFWKIYPETEVE